MRTMLAAILLVVLLPGLVLVNASAWALRTALDDAAFASTVGRVMDQPAIRAAIADRATTAIVDTLDAAPGRLQTVGAVVLQLTGQPTREQVATAIRARIITALAAAGVHQARDEAIAAVHAFLIGAATGSNRLVNLDGTQVVLDLSPLIEQAAAAIDDRLPQAGLDRIDAPAASVALADAATARNVKTAIDALRTLQIIIPLAVLAIIVAILALAHRRVRALGIVGLAMMVAGIASFALAWLGSGVVGTVPEDPVAAAVARGAYDAFVEVLVVQSLLFIAVGLFVGLAAWVVMGRETAPKGAPEPV